MSQNIPLAVGLVIVGSFCFALSAHFQHNAVDSHLNGNVHKERMGFVALLEAVQRPRWIIGLVFMAASFFLQFGALFIAPLTVVQPLGLLAFPWSILLAASASRTPVPPGIRMAVAVTVAATLAFTIVTGSHATADSELVIRRVVFGAFVVYLIAFVFASLGARGPAAWRCLFWSSGGALFYGLEAALVKSLMGYAKLHPWPFTTLFWCIVAALVFGAVAAGWFIQQGYATGAPEIVVGSMNVTSPVVAVAFGFLVLGEGTRITLPIALLMIALGAIAVSGVVALTRFHPTYVPAGEDADAEASDRDEIS
ncbi:MAG: hypothetical protein QM708_03605 [Propioniciclava sp.]|uniref:hypothetical protein n=1 Tax=Propioniciclava sp. TaxID=2038686 RepID=UPI0039E4DE70